MDIVFTSDRLRRDCTQDRWMQRSLGAARSKVLRRRLDQLRAAENLEHFRLAFHRGCHELKANRAGLLSVDLDGGHRLLVEPASKPRPIKPDGGLDWQRITAIRVVAVENTHD
jgi:proteic killer suppression protein